ncbi:multidrug resistance efflux transporter family protein [Neobacillus sp. SCS-31]|uniref:DMT family transporter n=1 Tax=Neobacillus oceani TaxID=3115292 RepID=UPI00390626CB
MKPIVLGIASAFFFAFTFVLNRSMELSGGHWIWSASLRYFFMIPFLLLIVAGRKNLKPLWDEMKQKPGAWLLWSTVGFGLFYAPICFAAAFSPGWLIAGTWLVTIVSGSLLSPLFFETKDGVRVRGRIPVKGMVMSTIILAGVAIMQLDHAKTLGTKEFLFGVVPVLIATFAYPLGNRKMMDVAGGRLDTFQRVLGMTIASLPFWLILSVYGALIADLPAKSQILQSAGVAVSSGVIATVLFFMATDLVRGDMTKMATVEATQSVEILFALGGEVLFLAAPFPSPISWAGIVLVIVGMGLHSFSAVIHTGNKKKAFAQEQA